MNDVLPFSVNRDRKLFQESWTGKPSNKLPPKLDTPDEKSVVETRDKRSQIEAPFKRGYCRRNNDGRLSAISGNKIGDMRGLKRQLNDQSNKSANPNNLIKRHCPQSYFPQYRAIPWAKYARTTGEMLAQHHVCAKAPESYSIPSHYFPFAKSQVPVHIQPNSGRMHCLEGATPIHTVPSRYTPDPIYPSQKSVFGWHNNFPKTSNMLSSSFGFEQFQSPQNYIIAPLPQRIAFQSDLKQVLEPLTKKPHLHRRKTKLLSSLKYNQNDSIHFQQSPTFEGKYEASGEESDDSGRPSST